MPLSESGRGHALVGQVVGLGRGRLHTQPGPKHSTAGGAVRLAVSESWGHLADSGAVVSRAVVCRCFFTHGEPSSSSEPHPATVWGPGAFTPQPASGSGRARGPRSPASPRLGATEAASSISISDKIDPKRGVWAFSSQPGLSVSSLMQLSGRRGRPRCQAPGADGGQEERSPSEAAARGGLSGPLDTQSGGKAVFPATSGCPGFWADHARCPGLLVSALESPRGRSWALTRLGALRTRASVS